MARAFMTALWFAARFAAPIYTMMFISIACGDSYPWLPPPGKAPLMVVSCHPDDEGIFFGGAIPHYAAAIRVPMVHISMTSGDAVLAPEVREDELRDADWVYGLRHEPLFPRFKDHGGLTLTQNWDLWLDGTLDNNPSQAAAGRLKAASYVATQIRRYQPEVVITHDFDGETPHTNHKATAWAVADAYALAADPNVNLDALPAWQTKKLYIHQSQANGLGTTGVTFQNWLFHDYWEDVSMDSNDDGTPDSTPRQIADLGLDCHVSQGPGCWEPSSVYRVGEPYDGHHSEWWGLYASTVGPDTTVGSFTIEGYTYTGWARGDFFEHVPEPSPEPSTLVLLAIAGIGLFICRSRKRLRSIAS